jgi:pimeloyl-ACP methyl ester carboxylesterase
MRAHVASLRVCSFAALICLTLVGGCTRHTPLPSVDRTTLKPKTSLELQQYLVEHEPELQLFKSPGPFPVSVQQNRELRLSAKERVQADWYPAAPPERAPLVIFVHGHESSKAAHGKQAMHLASWGMHSLSVQLPGRGPWSNNGRTLARIVSLIQRSPEVIDSRINVNKIILVGHSFGATAVGVALAAGAPALGAIMLDPAAIGRDLPALLRKVQRPMMILGGDDELYSTRNREYFFQYSRGAVAEVSIKDATHEDAQYPSDYALKNGGVDPNTTEELQITFVSALTAAAMSLAATGGFDYAWTSFGPAFDNGKFFNPKKK